MINKLSRKLTKKWAERSFSKINNKKVFLIFHDHEISNGQFYPFLRYRHKFIKAGLEFRAISYKKYSRTLPACHADAFFIQSPLNPVPGELERVLRHIKTNNPSSVIAYFDWLAPLDIRMAERVDQFVDFYVKKALFKNRSEYRMKIHGHTNLTEYYFLNYGTENPKADWSVPNTILPKLVVGSSFSTSYGLIHRFERNFPEHDFDRVIDVHARLAVSGTPWYSLMRRSAVEAISSIHDLKIVSGANVSKSQYFHELRRSKMVFSPFGYGEICWRDFEAIAMGALLIKPDMKHVEANPDIYIENETYIPVKWDFSDLDQQVRKMLADPDRRHAIARNAFRIVQNHLRDGSLESFALGITKREKTFTS